MALFSREREDFFTPTGLRSPQGLSSATSLYRTVFHPPPGCQIERTPADQQSEETSGTSQSTETFIAPNEFLSGVYTCQVSEKDLLSYRCLWNTNKTSFRAAHTSPFPLSFSPRVYIRKRAMWCMSNRPYEPTDLLTERTLAVQQLMGSRSLLPPSPTADELLQILQESGHPSISSLVPDTHTGVLDWPPTSFSAISIKCKCPTSRRVVSSFAAAGAHSMLGEMLQFFAESVTRLFTTGVADPSVRGFPSEWDRRLHEPAAASLRQHHLYELQGFSTLFTYMWGQVATCWPLLREQHGEQQDPTVSSEREMVLPTSVATRCTRSSSAKGPATQQPASQLLSLSSLAATVHQPQPLECTTSKDSSGCLRRRDTFAHARSALHLNSASLSLSGAEMAPIYCGGKRQKDGPISAASSRLASQPPTLAVLQHALTAQARAQRPFLPSIPPEGLVPSSGSRNGEGRHAEHSGAENASAQHLLASTSPTSKVKASHPTSAQIMSVEQAMELDRQRELQRKLGVRHVRNYAAEDDMRNYLDTYQASMRKVLGRDDVDDDNP